MNPHYQIGDRFMLGRKGEALLAQTGYGMVSLIMLRDGNRYAHAVEVKNVRDISIEEMSKIFDRPLHQLSRIKEE